MDQVRWEWWYVGDASVMEKVLVRQLKSGLKLQIELEKGKKLNFAGTCICNILILL